MIGAIVLAAGLSKRMGHNKLLLPFGSSTVIEMIVTEIMAAARLSDIVVITGHDRERIESTLARYPVRCAFNADYAQAEMIVSIQVGLRALGNAVEAALIMLGDQPRVQRDIIQRVIDAHEPTTLTVPSYQMKRGHPILLARSLWPRVLSLPQESTLRDVIQVSEDHIRYVVVENDSVLREMDMPEDYDVLVHRSARQTWVGAGAQID